MKAAHVARPWGGKKDRSTAMPRGVTRATSSTEREHLEMLLEPSHYSLVTLRIPLYPESMEVTFVQVNIQTKWQGSEESHSHEMRHPDTGGRGRTTTGVFHLENTVVRMLWKKMNRSKRTEKEKTIDVNIKTRATTTPVTQLITSQGSLAAGWALFFLLLS